MSVEKDLLNAIRVLAQEGYIKHVMVTLLHRETGEKHRVDMLFQTDESFIIRADPLKKLAKSEWARTA